MSAEQIPNRSEKLCADCPRRIRTSKLLARFAGVGEVCEGKITVTHGQFSSIDWRSDSGEPQPDMKDWNSVSTRRDTANRRELPENPTDEQIAEWWKEMTIEERHYQRTDWETDVLCGRDEIVPRAHEQPYDKYKPQPFTTKDGRRVAGFIGGSEEEIEEFRGMQAMMYIHDSLDEGAA